MTDAAARKRRQRANEKASGVKKVELPLTDLHSERLAWACEVSGYDASELVALLIHRYAERLEASIEDMGVCEYCGNAMPKGCAEKWKGHRDCFMTIKKREAVKV